IPRMLIPPCIMRPRCITARVEHWLSALVSRWAQRGVATGVTDANGRTATSTSTTTTNTSAIRTGTKTSTTATCLLSNQPAAHGSIIRNIAEVPLTQIEEPLTSMPRELAFSRAPWEQTVPLVETDSERVTRE